MARYSPSSTVAMPTRKVPAPSQRASAAAVFGSTTSRVRAPRTFTPAADDPLLALQAEITTKLSPAPKLTGHGKPTGGVTVFGARRAPARRAAFRTPPR